MLKIGLRERLLHPPLPDALEGVAAPVIFHIRLPVAGAKQPDRADGASQPADFVDHAAQVALVVPLDDQAFAAGIGRLAGRDVNAVVADIRPFQGQHVRHP